MSRVQKHAGSTSTFFVPMGSGTLASASATGVSATLGSATGVVDEIVGITVVEVVMTVVVLDVETDLVVVLPVVTT